MGVWALPLGSQWVSRFPARQPFPESTKRIFFAAKNRSICAFTKSGNGRHGRAEGLRVGRRLDLRWRQIAVADGPELPGSTAGEDGTGLVFCDLPRPEKRQQIKINLLPSAIAAIDRLVMASPHDSRGPIVEDLLARQAEAPADALAIEIGTLNAHMSELLAPDNERPFSNRAADDLAQAFRDLMDVVLARGSD